MDYLLRFHHGYVFTKELLKFNYDENLDLPYIQVDWTNAEEDNINQIMIAGYINGEYYNLLGIKRNGKTEITKYYLTLNDTKTNDVWYFKDENDLFETYECDNGSIRTCHLKNN